MYSQGQKIPDALEQYRLALRIVKDRDPETEAIIHFKIGKITM